MALLLAVILSALYIRNIAAHPANRSVPVTPSGWPHDETSKESQYLDLKTHTGGFRRKRSSIFSENIPRANLIRDIILIAIGVFLLVAVVLAVIASIKLAVCVTTVIVIAHLLIIGIVAILLLALAKRRLGELRGVQDVVM